MFRFPASTTAQRDSKVNGRFPLPLLVPTTFCIRETVGGFFAPNVCEHILDLRRIAENFSPSSVFLVGLS